MKKIFVILLSIFLLASCATLQPQPAPPPEQTFDEATLQKLIEALAGTAAANFRPFTCLIGGTTGCVDKISVDDLNEGDVAIVFTISGTDVRTYKYVFDDDGTDEEDTTYYTVIRPDDYDTEGNWRLVPLPLDTVVENTATTYSVTTLEALMGTFFVNTNAGTKTFVLPSAAPNMAVCIRNGQGVSQILRFDTDGTDYLVNPDGTRTSAAGDYYGCTADAGNQLCAVAFDTTDWYITSEVGTCAEE